MTMLKILCKLVSKQQSNSMLKKVKSLMRNASSYPLSNLWSNKVKRLNESERLELSPASKRSIARQYEVS